MPQQQNTQDPIVGRTIREVRPMTTAELRREGWEAMHGKSPTVVVLDDGTKLYASRDSAGNGPGMLFGTDPQGTTFSLV